MKKKLLWCDWALVVVGLLMLASGIQLEVLAGAEAWAVWAHVVVGVLFSFLVCWHVWLHFRWSNWFARFQKLKKPVTRILWYLFLLTFLLGLAAFIHWLNGGGHSPLGGIHGKVGFVMIAVAAGHTLKRRARLT